MKIRHKKWRITALPAGQKQAPAVPATGSWLLHPKPLHVSIFYTDTGFRLCLEVTQVFPHRLHQQNIFGSFQTGEIQLGRNSSKDKKKNPGKAQKSDSFPFLRVTETNCSVSLIFCCLHCSHTSTHWRHMRKSSELIKNLAAFFSCPSWGKHKLIGQEDTTGFIFFKAGMHMSKIKECSPEKKKKDTTKKKWK